MSLFSRLAYSSKEGINPPQIVLRHKGSNKRMQNHLPNCQKTSSGSALTFPPNDAAMIKEAQSDDNFSDKNTLTVRYGVGTRVDALLKFVFKCSFAGASRAVLRLYCDEGSTEGGLIVSVSGDWGKEAVTWNTAPTFPTGFAEEIGRVRKGKWYEIDVTSALSLFENNELTFRIEGLNENVASYGSKDDLFAPMLEVFF